MTQKKAIKPKKIINMSLRRMYKHLAIRFILMGLGLGICYHLYLTMKQEEQRITDKKNELDKITSFIATNQKTLQEYNLAKKDMEKLLMEKYETSTKIKIGYVKEIARIGLDYYNLKENKIEITDTGANCAGCLSKIHNQSKYYDFLTYEIKVYIDSFDEEKIFNFIDYYKSMLPGILIVDKMELKTVAPQTQVTAKDIEELRDEGIINIHNYRKRGEAKISVNLIFKWFFIVEK